MIRFQVTSKKSDVQLNSCQSTDAVSSTISSYEIELEELRDFNVTGEILPSNKLKMHVSPETFACYEVGKDYELTIAMQPQFAYTGACTCFEPALSGKDVCLAKNHYNLFSSGKLAAPAIYHY